MTAPAASRRAATTACLVVAALLVALAVRHVRALHAFGTFGMPVPDVLLLAVLVALLAATAALLGRANRAGLGRPAVRGLLAGIALLVVLVAGAPGADQLDPVDDGWFFSSAYSSTLFLDFTPELPWLVGFLVVAALGLLPVAGVAAAVGAAGRMRLTRRRRAALLASCAVAALLLLVVLERSVALLDLVRGEAQQLDEGHGVLWVASLWSLAAVLWAAGALLRSRVDVAQLALLVPLAVLPGAALLLLDERGRHDCCFSYTTEPYPVGEPEEVAQVPAYVPPPLGPDLLVLAGALAVGFAPPVTLRALQLRRVSTSASTPPG